MYTTLEVINEIMKNNEMKFVTIKDGKPITAFYNQKGGISIGNANLNLSKVVMDLVWEMTYETVDFLKAVNSDKKIKHESWIVFKSVQEALYDLLDNKIDEAINLINGKWHIG